MSLIVSIKKNLRLNLSLLFIMVSLAGCGSGELLVDKREVVPIQGVKIKFVRAMPNGDGSPAYVELSRSLERYGYFNGQFEYKYLTALVEAFRLNEISSSYEGMNIGSVQNDYSHALVITPQQFSHQANQGVVSLTAEMQLFDLKQKKMVWKKREHVSVSEMGSSFVSDRVADSVLRNWDHHGLISLKYGMPMKRGKVPGQ